MTLRRGVLQAALAVMLAGPTALAFFSGGYFDAPRAWAGSIAWALVLVAVLIEPRLLPSGRAAWLALGGLALLAAWSFLSMTWAPVVGRAYHSAQIVALYVGVLLAASMLLRSRGALRAVEPGLVAGAVIVIGYGVSERLLPGLLHFARSRTAHGRLEQPLTYWNAMGELAALGLVLALRVAGDATRPRRLRAAAAAATPLLGLGLYLSFSRGALFAAAAGVVALVVAAPRREQLRALAVGAAAAVLASIAAAPFAGVTSLSGSLSTREGQGVIALVLLVVITAAAGALHWVGVARERPAPVRLPRRAPLLALVIICLGLAVAIVAGASESSGRVRLGGSNSRLITLRSDRYAYWGVAFKAFAAEPLHGVGAGGWSVWWLRDRKINSFSQDAHSLEIQTLAELGVVGLALLAAFMAGLVLAAAGAHRVAPGLAAGPIAGLVTYFAHSPLDWDWEMPALTLVALVLAAALLALSDTRAADRDEGRRAQVGAPEPELTPTPA